MKIERDEASDQIKEQNSSAVKQSIQKLINSIPKDLSLAGGGVRLESDVALDLQLPKDYPSYATTLERTRCTASLEAVTDLTGQDLHIMLTIKSQQSFFVATHETILRKKPVSKPSTAAEFETDENESPYLYVYPQAQNLGIGKAIVQMADAYRSVIYARFKDHLNIGKIIVRTRDTTGTGWSTRRLREIGKLMTLDTHIRTIRM